jgi:hypothetical protein
MGQIEQDLLEDGDIIQSPKRYVLNTRKKHE